MTIVRHNVRIKRSIIISFLLQLRTAMVNVKGKVKFTRLEVRCGNVLLRSSLEEKFRMSLRTVAAVAR